MPIKRPRTPRTLSEPELLEYAVKSLASKMKSERDMRQRMRDRAEPGEEGALAIDAVVVKLKEYGYLSDERFAADYTRIRQETDKFGQRRVQQGLMQKGIANPLVKQTLAAAYDDVDEVALARAYIARKRMKQPSCDREQKQKETAKAMRRLIAAGFSTGAVWKVLRGWDAEVEEVDVVDDSV